jgi:glyoxalase family protein
MQITGIHHITAITSKISDNLDFYTNILGLRLVKKTVNQDDVSAYHLFYADKLGTPGTDMTFFDWPEIGPNVQGTDSIVGTSFRVSGQSSLDFWSVRLKDKGILHGEITEFAGRQILPFQDPEGQQLYLVNDHGSTYEGEIWHHPEILDEFALKGLYSVILSVPSNKKLDRIFKGILNYEKVERALWLDKDSKAVIYTTKQNGGPGSEIWLLEQPYKTQARLGAGGTHHVALRVDNIETQKKWHSHLIQEGFHVSPLIDRYWFHSIYFRVSAGILFEIATDGPGFDIDEAPDKLGEKLVLPPFLEKQRQDIEASLIPIGA